MRMVTLRGTLAREPKAVVLGSKVNSGHCNISHLDLRFIAIALSICHFSYISKQNPGVEIELDVRLLGRDDLCAEGVVVT